MKQFLKGFFCSGIDACSVAAISKLYADQEAYVDIGTGARSKLFNILRGVRQGDPLSPALFANSIRISMKTLKTKWERSGLGTLVGSDARGNGRISFAMFADDTTIVER